MERQQKGSCLMDAKRPAFITNAFDRFPPSVRRRLADHRHDICCACLVERVRDLIGPFVLADPGMEPYFHKAIDDIERKIDNALQAEIQQAGAPRQERPELQV